MTYGIAKKSFEMIRHSIEKYPEIEKVMIFGSRAMGNYKNGSDIDLALYGDKITDDIVRSLTVQLNEVLPIPYYFDIVHYETLNDKDLKEHITTEGKGFLGLE